MPSIGSLDSTNWPQSSQDQRYSGISNPSVFQGSGVRCQGSGFRDQVSPVKFAALVFFEEFNGASRAKGSGISTTAEYQIHAYEFHQTDDPYLSALQENRHNLLEPPPGHSFCRKPLSS